jgi:hypothetical protein
MNRNEDGFGPSSPSTSNMGKGKRRILPQAQDAGRKSEKPFLNK